MRFATALDASTLKPRGFATVPSAKPGFPSSIATVRTPFFFVGGNASARAGAPAVRRPSDRTAAIRAAVSTRATSRRFDAGFVAT